MSVFGFADNPVLLRELRERLASRRTMVMLTLWLAILSALVAIYYRSETGRNFGGFQPAVTELATIGQNLFEWVLFFMMGLVLFLVPGFTAASIAGERERQTLLPLQVTLLRPFSIVIGKVGASVAFTLLLIVATLPLLAFAYLIGGVTIADVFIALAMMVFTALALACVTVACSAMVKRVQGAIVLAYAITALLVVGTLIAYGLAWGFDESRGFDAANPPNTIVAANPFVAIADVSGESEVFNDFFFDGPFGGSVDTPLDALREMVDHRDNFGQFGGGLVFDEFGQPDFDNSNFEERFIDGLLPLWAQYLIIVGSMAVFSLWIATRRVTTPAKVER